MEPIKTDISVALIDDELILMQGLLMYLEDMGFKASGYSSQEDALAALRLSPPDICIIDLRMPGKNGEDMVREIHSIAPTVHCMIFTGSYYRVPDDIKALGLTDEDVIQKPIQDYPKLFNRLANIKKYS